jgi:hypothetical protein
LSRLTICEDSGFLIDLDQMEKTWLPKVQSCRFVTAGELFNGLPIARETFEDNASNFSWGDNTRSLVDLSFIFDALSGLEYEEEQEKVEVDKLIVRLQCCRSFGVLVDLEN